MDVSSVRIHFFVLCVLCILFVPAALSAEEGGTATAESQAVNFEASKAFDGAMNTGWKAEMGEGPVSLVYTFSSSRTLQRIQTAFPPGKAYLYHIEASQENSGGQSRWTTLVPEKLGKNTMTDAFEPVTVTAVRTTLRNLLQNSGFEQGESVEGWEMGDGELTTVPDEVHTGKRAIRDSSGYVVMVYPLNLSVEGQKPYTFSFYGKSPDKATGYLLVFAEKEDMTTVELEKSLGMFRPEYTFQRAAFFLPKDVTYLQRANFYHFNQKGVIFYDDVFLIPGWTPSDIPEIREQIFEGPEPSEETPEENKIEAVDDREHR
ncbi:MAG: discoidin domain-containing protein [Candidatus Omnitrophota bacterium]